MAISGSRPFAGTAHDLLKHVPTHVQGNPSKPSRGFANLARCPRAMAEAAALEVCCLRDDRLFLANLQEMKLIRQHITTCDVLLWPSQGGVVWQRLSGQVCGLRLRLSQSGALEKKAACLSCAFPFARQNFESRAGGAPWKKC